MLRIRFEWDPDPAVELDPLMIQDPGFGSGSNRNLCIAIVINILRFYWHFRSGFLKPSVPLNPSIEKGSGSDFFQTGSGSLTLIRIRNTGCEED